MDKLMFANNERNKMMIGSSTMYSGTGKRAITP